MSTEPSREHVEAVAEAIRRYWTHPDGGKAVKAAETHQRDEATDILTSTDPAMLDAMQDALVRHGWLTEEHREWDAKTDRARQHFVTRWRDWREVDPPTE